MAKGLYVKTYGIGNGDYVTARASLYIPLPSNSTEIRCCAGYRLLNDTCYWAVAPKTNYEMALKKWNQAILVQQFNGYYDNCPSFLFEVDYEVFYSELQFWGAFAIVLSIFLLMLFSFVCTEMIHRNANMAHHNIMVPIVSTFLWTGTMTMLAIVSFSIFVPVVVIPVDYIWISMGNPSPIICMIFSTITTASIAVQTYYNIVQCKKSIKKSIKKRHESIENTPIPKTTEGETTKDNITEV